MHTSVDNEIQLTTSGDGKRIGYKRHRSVRKPDRMLIYYLVVCGVFLKLWIALLIKN